VPDCWIYVQDTGVKLGRIQIFNNWSPYMVKDPENTVWIGLEYFCSEGDEFWNMNDAECVDFATKELEKMGVISSGDVLDSHRERVKKAYPAYFDTYDRMDELTAWLNSIDGLYCVGRNGQHRYNNMDHSMVTAMRAAQCILGERQDKMDIWNVNTEQTYHEEQKEEQA
jgi:protoporphyrinogen oxidase